MLASSRADSPGDDWQGQLRDVIGSGDELLALLGLTPAQVGASEQACREFGLKVPRAFARRMRAGDPRDPLLLQVLASERELLAVPGFVRDPVGEADANPHRGIIHKYQGRVLLIVSGGCAIHCRYCFRRHFPYADNQNSRREWDAALGHIAGDPGISEVILSGGDPLVAGDRYLGDLIDRVTAIPHVRRLRIHTRLPVVIPDRVTPGLIGAICRPGTDTVMVIHSNHANEIDASVAEALGQLQGDGITLLNQAVLLRGVNDTAQAQVALSERLFGAGVMPYYLHLLDRVQGAAHFEVAEEQARRLLADIAAQLPGYLVPRLVREAAGAHSKLALEPLY